MILISEQLYAQTTSASFDIIKSPSCIDENLQLQNNSTGAFSYLWDFCVGDLNEVPNAELLTDVINRPYKVELVKYNNQHIGFVSDRTIKTLHRIDFEDSTLTNFISVDLNLSFVDPLSVEIFDINGVWYGLLISYNNELIKLNFGNSPLNSPIIESLGDFGSLNGPVDISVVINETSIYAFIVNYGSSYVTRIRWDKLFENQIIDEINIIGISQMTAISTVNEGQDWISFLTSRGNDKIFKILFGTNLSNATPTISEVSYISQPVIAPTGISTVEEGGVFFHFIETQSGNFYKINSGTTLLDMITTSTENLGDFNFLGLTWRISVFQINSKWHGFSSNNSSNNIYKYSFPQICSASQSTSNLLKPAEISYNNSGSKIIELKAFDINGIPSFMSKTINVSTDIIPDITASSQNICLINPINFTSSNISGDISSYSWDFGDTNTSTIANPWHTYTVAGTYEVTLNVQSSNGCNNFTKQTIKVYDPPIPDFTLPTGLICTNETYTFTNNTVDNFDGNLTYEWQVDGVSVGTNQDLLYSFTTGGAKEIKLITSIPGCSIEQVQTITNVEEGATPAFTAQDDCVVSPINFVNQSIGGVSYEWDFGDGNTSIVQNVSHQYAAPGIYEVVLKVTNSVGCITSTLNQVQVHAMPIAEFSQDLSCSDAITTFVDESTIASTANIMEWNWTFEDGASYTVQHPEHVFATSGQYDVSLTVRTNAGCEASVLHTITVLESPRANFTIQEKCIEDAFIFNDASIPNAGSAIVAYNWDIDGMPYSGSQASHIFSQANTYQTKLTIESDNNCIAEATQTILVDPLPVASFTITNTCVGSETVFIENSNTPNDEVVQWQWMIDGKEASTSPIMQHTFQKVGVYSVQLNLTTLKGCDIISTLQNVVIHDVPVADFELSQNYGETPLLVEFANLSTNADIYLWDFAGFANSINSNPSFIFTELGEHPISLTAVNEFGCDSTISKTVYVVNPVVDIELTNVLEVVADEYLLTIKNNSNIPLYEVSIDIDLGGKVKLKENINLNLLPGKSINHPLSFSIPSVNDLGYLCFTLAVENVIYPEKNTDDNKDCISINDDVEIINVYPNPVKEFLNIPFVAKNGQEMIIQLIDIRGNIVISDIYQADNEGLNTLQLDLVSLAQGIYILNIQLEDEKQTHRIYVE